MVFTGREECALYSLIINFICTIIWILQPSIFCEKLFKVTQLEKEQKKIALKERTFYFRKIRQLRRKISSNSLVGVLPGLESIKFFRKIFKLTQDITEQNKTALKKTELSFFTKHTRFE